nr:hypothetical protein BV87_19270 [Sphingobium yanoikuyae]
MKLLVVHDHPLSLEYDADPPVTKATALARDVLDSVTDGNLVRRAFTPNRLQIDTKQPAGAALRNLVIAQHPQHCVSRRARFSQKIHQDGVVQRTVRQQALQLAVLVLQLAQTAIISTGPDPTLFGRVGRLAASIKLPGVPVPGGT